jgi:hypothetical protein
MQKNRPPGPAVDRGAFLLGVQPFQAPTDIAAEVVVVCFGDATAGKYRLQMIGRWKYVILRQQVPDAR